MASHRTTRTGKARGRTGGRPAVSAGDRAATVAHRDPAAAPSRTARALPRTGVAELAD
ncbi:hypothetical protein ACEZDB_22420 [Streptacidiphilus sp. N1-3]|uniref:Uncharacterized protein n=1 Tax=Streptacidiphilus alkalitolerans TaxID=3342712 RepID=A0ABV6X569_9ACTN